MYIVPDVPLIPQTNDGACWFACAQMLIQWRRESMQASEIGIVDPTEDFELVWKWYWGNGLTDNLILPMAKKLGLKVIPPVSPTITAIDQWLHYYGPLWTNGSKHITVVTGVDIKGGRVFVHDPWPVNKGAAEWRSMNWLYGIGKAAGTDSLDPKTNAGVFLHCP
jgi:Papain-like cysteine protease AvrRpt2